MVAQRSLNFTDDRLASYARLKETTIDELKDICDARWEDVLKQYNSGIISNRTRSKLRKSKSLKELIEIFEQRDILSADDVDELAKLSEFLRCASVGMYIDQYRKQEEISAELSNACVVCGITTEEYEAQNNTSGGASSPTAQFNAVDAAILLVSKEIGEDWPRVARAMNVREGDIDNWEFDALEEGTDMIISRMFQEWKHRRTLEEKPVTVEILRKTLTKARRAELAALF